MITSNEYLRIATISGVHGLNGRLKIYCITDIPERFSKGNEILVKTAAGYQAYVVAEFQEYKAKICLLGLQGLAKREDAEKLVGTGIYIDKEVAERTRDVLEEDSFYYYDLLEAHVFMNDASFGKVEDILEAGSGIILVIRDEDGRDHLIPFVESMVDTSRLNDRRIDIHPVEGIIDI